MAGFIASDKGQEVTELTARMEEITKQGTAKPVVPLLTATYEADQATYDAQDVIWALHDDPIV